MPRIITRRSRAFRARWIEPSITALRRWVAAARGTESEPYALEALAERLRRAA